MTGRPSKLTPEVHATIVEALKRGNTREDAAAIARVASRSIRTWIEKAGQDDAEDKFLDFAADVAEAETSVRSTMIESITDAARGGDWKAGAFYLERRDPAWRQNKGVELTGEGGGPVNIGVIVLPPEIIEDDGEDDSGEAC